jgi:hypothetical protein
METMDQGTLFYEEADQVGDPDCLYYCFHSHIFSIQDQLVSTYWHICLPPVHCVNCLVFVSKNSK